MRKIARTFALLATFGICLAEEGQVEEPPSPLKPDLTLRLWPGDAPGLVQPAAPETTDETLRVKNVSVPELRVYLPKDAKESRPAILICPGGGFGHLSMGVHIQNNVDLFNKEGVVVIGLKYRTKYGKNDPAKDSLADCIQAMRLIRSHAAEWGIDPKRVGIQGYSAGGTVCINLLGNHDAGDPSSTDPVAKQSSRPDFMALMCPWPNHKTAADFPIKPNSPPVFIASAKDDNTAPTAFAMEIAKAIKQQTGKVTMFVVPTGGHGAFQLGVAKGPGITWPQYFLPLIPKPEAP
jgi:acetyl esterase/lipase